MKSYILIVFVFLFQINGFSQNKKELQSQVAKLIEEKQKLIDENLSLKKEALDLKGEILDLKAEGINLRNENEGLRKSLSRIVSQPTQSNQDNTKLNLISTPKPTGQRCQAITTKGTQCTRMAEPESIYCWQHKSIYESASTAKSSSNSSKSNLSSGSSSGTTSSGRTIYTGPRGGRYYINSKGNKVYIRK